MRNLNQELKSNIKYNVYYEDEAYEYLTKEEALKTIKAFQRNLKVDGYETYVTKYKNWLFIKIK